MTLRLTYDQRRQHRLLKAQADAILKPARDEARKAVKTAQRAREVRVGPSEAGQRAPRVREPVYLAWIRRLPCAYGCVTGGCTGPVEACHLRAASAKHHKPNAGLQRKPDDRPWALPGCRGHHLLQHSRSELAHWQSVGIDPFELCLALSAAFLSGRDGAAVIRSTRAR